MVNAIISGNNKIYKYWKSNLLFLQWYYWYWSLWFKHVKIRPKKTYKNLDIYNIRYVTIKKIGSSSGYDINSVNPLYLHINNANGYIEKINEDKYLVFDDADENKELLKRYDDVLMELWIKLKI